MRSVCVRLCAVMLVGACAPPAIPGAGTAVTQATHTPYFPILDGTNHALGRAALDGPIACETCHISSQTSFAVFTCTACHEHPQNIIDRLHTTVAQYQYTSDGCYSCHKDGARVAYDHPGVKSGCIDCHNQGALYAPNPPPQQVTGHPPVTDCGGCHNTQSWLDAGFAPSDSSDPNQDVPVNAQIPTYSGTRIASLTPQTELLPMKMNHGSQQIPSGAMSACTNCHIDAASAQYYPGVFHGSLVSLTLPQPTACSDCHDSSTMPNGFVGPAPGGATVVRSPASGEMKHDAVAWVAGVPSSTRLVTDDCAVCHIAPTDPVETWSTSAVVGRVLAWQSTH
jgi:hypothetical protein